MTNEEKYSKFAQPDTPVRVNGEYSEVTNYVAFAPVTQEILDTVVPCEDACGRTVADFSLSVFEAKGQNYILISGRLNGDTRIRHTEADDLADWEGLMGPLGAGSDTWLTVAEMAPLRVEEA